jgi:DNA segregation ATPase FtsK/SpoIIIE-like protein
MNKKAMMKKRLLDAIKFLKSYDYASPSLLQRSLMISYYQAVRLMKRLEQLGAVGPNRGKNPRLILVNKVKSISYRE